LKNRDEDNFVQNNNVFVLYVFYNQALLSKRDVKNATLHKKSSEFPRKLETVLAVA
jgi:hypothetical protein